MLARAAAWMRLERQISPTPASNRTLTPEPFEAVLDRRDEAIRLEYRRVSDRIDRTVDEAVDRVSKGLEQRHVAVQQSLQVLLDRFDKLDEHPVGRETDSLERRLAHIEQTGDERCYQIVHNNLDETFHGIDAQFERLRERVELTDDRFRYVDERFRQLHTRFDAMEKRFDKVDCWHFTDMAREFSLRSIEAYQASAAIRTNTMAKCPRDRISPIAIINPTSPSNLLFPPAMLHFPDTVIRLWDLQEAKNLFKFVSICDFYGVTPDEIVKQGLSLSGSFEVEVDEDEGDAGVVSSTCPWNPRDKWYKLHTAVQENARAALFCLAGRLYLDFEEISAGMEPVLLYRQRQAEREGNGNGKKRSAGREDGPGTGDAGDGDGQSNKRQATDTAAPVEPRYDLTEVVSSTISQPRLTVYGQMTPFPPPPPLLLP